MALKSPLNMQQIIFALNTYWSKNDCILLQGLDLEVGAGTFHPSTFFRALGPKHWAAAYVQPSRRPEDGRYGVNPNRLQHYYQYQVVIKPSPENLQKLYLSSLAALGINSKKNDVKFIEDNWESPTIGAWGIGWEVWLNGVEISQFTYFQQIGGLKCKPIMGELTYGLERIAMSVQKVKSYSEIIWGITGNGKNSISYGEIFSQNEAETSQYNFKESNIKLLLSQFNTYEEESYRLLGLNLVLPTYELFLKNSHIFNLLAARGAISASERQRYILRLRTISRNIAELYCNHNNFKIL